MVIAGAGYAGLAAFLALRGQVESGSLQVEIVNADDRHLLLPELPLFLAGKNGEDQVRLHLKRILPKDVRLIVARVESIDVSGPALVCHGTTGRIPCDGLIVTLGSIPSDFGVPGVKENSIPIGRWDDIAALRQQLLEDLHGKSGRNVAVIGGGFTGVEIAADLAEQAQREQSHLIVTLIGPGILPSMPDEMQQRAAAGLRQLDVRFVSGRVRAVEPGKVCLASGPVVEAETIVWAAGVQANPVLSHSGLRVNHRGQVTADPFLRIAPRVFGAGDCVQVIDTKTHRPIAPTAQAALQSGPAAGWNLLRDLQGQELLPFHPKDRGFLVSLGRHNATGTVSGHNVQGGDAAALKRVIELYHAFQVGGLHALAHQLVQAAH